MNDGKNAAYWLARDQRRRAALVARAERLEAAAELVTRANTPVTVVAQCGTEITVSIEQRWGEYFWRFEPPHGRDLIKFTDLPEAWRTAAKYAIQNYSEVKDSPLYPDEEPR